MQNVPLVNLRGVSPFPKSYLESRYASATSPVGVDALPRLSANNPPTAPNTSGYAISKNTDGSPTGEVTVKTNAPTRKSGKYPATTLSEKSDCDSVHVEIDVVVKYVENMLERYHPEYNRRRRVLRQLVFLFPLSDCCVEEENEGRSDTNQCCKDPRRIEVERRGETDETGYEEGFHAVFQSEKKQ